ncbi:MAG TPA: polyprenyl synthetase family protein [Nocardioides sp.]|uniref:polyprenyl synthetase family protein n=1 Tax=Nocardioides sp. TaxID=35761 RepID=UPI002E305605|nr:polyprenyl synthetase family protein [Nocardioides sp.]HEX3930868.1 polyprenyl synthetase family protein [Nocardioides sp.]
MTAVAVVGRGRELVEPALRDAVSRLDDDTRLVASYHLGWNDSDGRPVDGNGGKGVRPGLLMLVGESLGGAPADLLPGAVAVELVHNFSLIHDDLMDRDTERRHRRTVWSIWGDATAVLVGDALLSLAHEILAESGSPHAAAAERSLSLATRELIRGQVLDVAFERRDDVTLTQCIDMAAGKTGSLLSVSTELGALLSGAPAEVSAAFAEFGAEVGIAFQLVDDLLGIWGWPERTGKPVFSDLRSRKKTMPVVWATTHGGLAGRQLADWLADTSSEPTEADLRQAADLVERAGGRHWAHEEALARVALAHNALAGVGLDLAHRAELDRLAAFVVERDL